LINLILVQVLYLVNILINLILVQNFTTITLMIIDTVKIKFPKLFPENLIKSLL